MSPPEKIRDFELRVFFCLLFFLLLCCAFYIPIFPDELSRLDYASELRKTGQYNFYWPPLTVAIIALNPFAEYGPVGVRVLQIILTLPVIYLATQSLKYRYQIVLLLIAFPYLALVISTGMQQGLILATIGMVALMPNMRLPFKSILLSFSYAINPSLIVICTIALFFESLKTKDFIKPIKILSLSYFLLLPWVFWAWTQTGEILVTLSTNGPFNLFLGNNPNPLSHRGVGSALETIALWELSQNASHTQLVYEFLVRDPFEFFHNIVTKFLLYLSPADYIRSATAHKLEVIRVAYFSVVQMIIMILLLVCFRCRLQTNTILFCIFLFLASWLLYTGFFVKVRFRMPFDILILLSLLMNRDLFAVFPTQFKWRH